MSRAIFAVAIGALSFMANILARRARIAGITTPAEWLERYKN
jgi:hypothetical protein